MLFCARLVAKVQAIGVPWLIPPTLFNMPSLLCRSPLSHGADQGPDSSGACGGTVGQAGTTPGPV